MAPLTRGKMSRREQEAWLEAHLWQPSPESGLDIETDLAPARWIEPRLRQGSSEIGHIVPRGYAAYARIFFPFAGELVVTDGRVNDQEQVTWTETADRNGRVAHALMEQETYLAGSAACVAEVLAAPEIDAYETNPRAPAFAGMDLINDPDGIVPRTV